MVGKLTFLLILLLLVAAGVTAQSNIRNVDFKNFTHKLSCGSADAVSRVRVREGEFRGDKRGIAVYLQIYKVTYGDINLDGKDEAVVLYSCGSGASYVYIWGLVYGVKNGKPVLLTRLAGGNKSDGGFFDVSIKRNILIVQRYQVGVAGSPCCAETIETARYRLRGKKLRQVGRLIFS